jgi:hypothetical protein
MPNGPKPDMAYFIQEKSATFVLSHHVAHFRSDSLATSPAVASHSSPSLLSKLRRGSV